MLRKPKGWSLMGAAAVAAWLALAPAQAYEGYYVVSHSRPADSGEASEDISDLRSEISELRSTARSNAAGYESQACGPHGCQTCGGCGCNTCGCDTCGCSSCCDPCCGGGTCGCFEPCCHSSGIWAMGELLFLRYHRADGVRVGVGNGEDEEFDFDMTPRLSVGWVRSDGLGARIRYWQFDHNSNDDGDADHLDLDTYTWDLETFDTFCLNRNWDLELAAGIRYNEFREAMFDPAVNDVRLNSFTGYGGLVSAELRRCVGTSGAVFLRARGAILMSDKDVFNTDGNQQERLFDVTIGITEFAFGYDYVMPMSGGAYAFARVQAEWQNWYNFSSGFEDTANTEEFAGPSDVGFGGYGFAIGLAR